MTDVAVGLIRRDERERIVRLLENDAQVNGNGKMMMDHILSLIQNIDAY